MIEFKHDTEHPIEISVEDHRLDGILHIPSTPRGLVIFAHGSGSSRLSPRNQYIARVFQYNKLATLLFDLLTPEEEQIDSVTSQFRFDIDFLATRLEAATIWLQKNPILKSLPVGYFGASTGGAAALIAAARNQNIVKAVVSRGGRPDLAGDSLPYVTAPTLLIVGGLDEQVIDLNKQAFNQLRCTKKIEIVPGATHLFEEPGKLADVARLSQDWFSHYLI